MVSRRRRITRVVCALLALLFACAPIAAQDGLEAQVQEIERLATAAPPAVSNARIQALQPHQHELTTTQRQRIEYVRLRNIAIAGDQAEALRGMQALLRQRMPAPLRVRIYATAATIATNVGDWALAYTWLNESLNYLAAAPDDAPRMLAVASYLQSLIGDDAKAREFGLRAVHLAERGNDALVLCRAMFGMALLEQSAKSHAEPEAWRRRQIEACSRAGDQIFVANAETGLGKIEAARGNPVEALRWYRQALQRDESAGYEAGIHEANMGIAETLIATGVHLDDARARLERGLRFFRKEKSSVSIEEAERQLATLAELQGDSVLALAHLKNAMTAAAEMQRTTHERQIAYQQVQFDTRLKQQQIDLLQTEQALANLEITAATRRQWLLVAGGCVLLLSVGLLYVLLRRSSRERQRYRWQSEHDGLTRLFNHKRVHTLGKDAWEEARRRGLPFSAVVLDIDLFKQVNDRHGHAAGDEALRALGGWIQDAVGADGIAGRSGGDEFTLLINGSAAKAADIVSDIRNAIAPVTVFGSTLSFHISAGICEADEKTASLEALIHDADRALQRAKQGGRDRVERVDDGTPARAATPGLVIVGSGIQFGRHVSQRCESEIRHAEVVLCLVDPFALAMIREQRPDAVNLGEHYADGKDRRETYREIDAAIMAQVRAGKHVCAVFYGHPGVFADVPHRVLRRAREEGFSARMEPGISAEACLYADVGIDPGRHGVQSLEATHFLCHERPLNPAGLVLLWQVALAGDLSCSRREAERAGLQALVDKLLRWYPPEHEVILYEAARLPIETPRIDRLRLCDLPDARYQEFTTLVILPLAPALDSALDPAAPAMPEAGPGAP